MFQLLADSQRSISSPIGRSLSVLAIWQWVIGGLILLLAHNFILGWFWHSKYKLPPKVLGLPIIGNALQVPATQQGPWAKKMAEKYGEM